MVENDRTCGSCRHWKEPDMVWDDKTNTWKSGDWRWCADVIVTDRRTMDFDRGEAVPLRIARSIGLPFSTHLRTREHFGCRRFESLSHVVDEDEFWSAA